MRCTDGLVAANTCWGVLHEDAGVHQDKVAL